MTCLWSKGKSAAQLGAEPIPLPKARDQQTNIWMRASIRFVKKIHSSLARKFSLHLMF